jgi:riboflavin-specific deaminase-like protein
LAVSSATPDEEGVWKLLLALAKRAAAGGAVSDARGLRLGPSGELEFVDEQLGWLDDDATTNPGLGLATEGTELLDLLDLYLPFCIGDRAARYVVGHLGQSIDGRIAAPDGSSRYVTGPENMRHMHRLRALSDAVMVGAGTVEHDDPRLTTRLVEGESPARVVIDPYQRLENTRQVFRDPGFRTLVVTAPETGRRGDLPTHVERVEIPLSDGILPVSEILEALERRGLRRIFIEGGGVTVSHFLAAGLFTRLHIAVSPVLVGSGRPGILLPDVQRLDQALRPEVRRYCTGQDMLFDFSFDARV